MKHRIVAVVLVSAMLLLTLATGAAAADPLIHTVKWGESLSWISWMYKTTVQEIVDANAIANRHLIYAGQKLIIPIEPEEYVEYTVKAGDSLLAIAARFNVKMWDIARRNGIWNVNLIFVGQKLIIPGGGEETPAPKAEAPKKQADIVISSPTDSAEIKSPVAVTGWGSAAENQLAVDVLDEAGKVIGQGFVKVNAEMGQYGPFSGEITFTAPATPQMGRVAVYRVSARDGAIEQLSSVSVKFK